LGKNGLFAFIPKGRDRDERTGHPEEYSPRRNCITDQRKEKPKREMVKNDKKVKKAQGRRDDTLW